MGSGVSQIATTLKNLGSDLVYEQLYAFGSAFNAGDVDNAEETVLTDYSCKLDYRFTSNHAENLAISMWRSDSVIFCQLTASVAKLLCLPTSQM